jgi:hypothetical protein
MKRYPVSVARERLADVLDAADAGEGVIIERRGVQYEIRTKKRTTSRREPAPVITAADRAVTGGEWTWNMGENGLTFGARPRR